MLLIFPVCALAQSRKHFSILDYQDTFHSEEVLLIEDAKKNSLELIQKWHQEGYLLASIDSFYTNDTIFISFIHKGNKYIWNQIYISHLPNDLQDLILKKWGKVTSRITNPEELKLLYGIIYEYAEENRYPFAEIYFDSITLKNDTISARMQYEPGIPAKIDSIKVNYDQYISYGFLKNYLGLYHGMPYDIKTFKKINTKISALPFVKQKQPWEIFFGIEKNELNLYLQERKANQANGIIGLQPSQEDEKKYIITADVMFKVYNTFGYAEMFHLSYQQIQNNSPKFNMAVQWPYLFNTKWGIDANFDFLKFDTLFRKTNAHIGAQYQIDEQNYFTFFYETEGNRTIHFDTTYMRIHKKLPSNIDIRKQGIGVTYQLGKLDDVFIPTRGYTAKLTGATYTKKILKNNAIEYIADADIFDYNQLFDTLKNSIFQFKLQSDIQAFYTFGRILTLKISNHNGWIGGNNFIYKNELFTLGGLKMLRGFNEMSVFASNYFMGVIEPRVYIGDNSYVYAFSDFAYLTAHFNDNTIEKKWMKSLGIGAQLNTNTGLFQIAFALGKDGNNPMPYLRDTRVHIGYSLYF